MAKIHELSTILADQIAAGEVVERPASVVKELVENAIDAKSTQIDIYVKDAGVKEITVIDNGEGILQEDVALAFFRHATSKITDRNDLFQVKTLGFRGEALPSIASIADVKVETANIAETEGTVSGDDYIAAFVALGLRRINRIKFRIIYSNFLQGFIQGAEIRSADLCPLLCLTQLGGCHKFHCLGNLHSALHTFDTQLYRFHVCSHSASS